MTADNAGYTVGTDILPTNETREAVEKYAESVASALQFTAGQNPAELVAAIGGTIHYTHIDELSGISGSLRVHGPNKFDVYLPHYTSSARDCFTIAHELGHYYLHSRQGAVPIVAYRHGSTRIEWEANWFAAALLMPRTEFRTVHADMNGNIYAVAQHFGVSAEAAEVRKKVVFGA